MSTPEVNWDDLAWPAAPTIHHVNPVFRYADIPIIWRPPQGRVVQPDAQGYPNPYAPTYRTCSYCGSMHPYDLVQALLHGATLDAADRKYGYLHKFYVEGMPNPIAGEMCAASWSSDLERLPDGTEHWVKHIKPSPAPPTLFAKFYTAHLTELEPATREAVSALLNHTPSTPPPTIKGPPNDPTA